MSAHRVDLDAIVRDAPRYGLEIIARVDTGQRTGLVLSIRANAPGVVGLGVVDIDGEHAVVGLDDDEATALRDALTAWLEGER